MGGSRSVVGDRWLDEDEDEDEDEDYDEEGDEWWDDEEGEEEDGDFYFDQDQDQYDDDEEGDEWERGRGVGRSRPPSSARSRPSPRGRFRERSGADSISEPGAEAEGDDGVIRSKADFERLWDQSLRRAPVESDSTRPGQDGQGAGPA